MKTLNEEIQELVNPAAPFIPELSAFGKVFREGDRVIQIKNKGGISNGDIGYVKSIHNGDDNDSTLTVEFSDASAIRFWDNVSRQNMKKLKGIHDDVTFTKTSLSAKVSGRQAENLYDTAQ